MADRGPDLFYGQTRIGPVPDPSSAFGRWFARAVEEQAFEDRYGGWTDPARDELLGYLPNGQPLTLVEYIDTLRECGFRLDDDTNRYCLVGRLEEEVKRMLGRRC